MHTFVGREEVVPAVCQAIECLHVWVQEKDWEKALPIGELLSRLDIHTWQLDGPEDKEGTFQAVQDIRVFEMRDEEWNPVVLGRDLLQCFLQGNWYHEQAADIYVSILGRSVQKLEEVLDGMELAEEKRQEIYGSLLRSFQHPAPFHEDLFVDLLGLMKDKTWQITYVYDSTVFRAVRFVQILKLRKAAEDVDDIDLYAQAALEAGTEEPKYLPAIEELVLEVCQKTGTDPEPLWDELAEYQYVLKEEGIPRYAWLRGMLDEE